MKYDFDTAPSRRHTDSLKWDVAEGELPMWVADMDFATASEIQAEICKRAAHGIYGYTVVPDEWYTAYINWWKNRHGLTLQKDWLIFCSGVVPALSSIVRKLTTPAEKVLILTPVYNIFFNSIVNNGRQVLECPLQYDGDGYEIDFSDLEQKLADPQTSLMILCNPHNPVGKIWDRPTLERIAELCEKYSVTVVSDEIHCDLTEPGARYVPFIDVCANSIACVAPTKTFNLAGLQSAAVIVPDPAVRHKVWRGLNTDEVAEPNFFAAQAACAAFTKGGKWLEELRAYISQNKRYVKDFLSFSKIKVVSSQATYLLWLDCSAITQDTASLADFIRQKTGLYLSAGAQFGGNGGGFIRMNVACPLKTLQDGLSRLKYALELYAVS